MKMTEDELYLHLLISKVDDMIDKYRGDDSYNARSLKHSLFQARDNLNEAKRVVQ